MDTVMFDGVEYVKAAVAAKQFRYTADYVGQLCRGKKIDARLIGRTWFVNLASLKDHKRSRHQKSVTDTTSSKISMDSQYSKDVRTSRKHEVAPRVKTVTLKQTKQSHVGDQLLRHLKVAYEPDDENLIPTLHKKQVRPPRTIKIEHVDAKRLSITGKRDEILFQAGELPEVSLSGKLEVKSYPDIEDDPKKDETEANENVSDTRDNFINKVMSAKEKNDTTPDDQTSKLSVTDDEVKNVVLQKGNKGPRDAQESTIVTKQLERPVVTSGIKKSDHISPSSFTPRSVIKVPKERVSTLVLVSPLIATFIAVACVVFIMLASVSVVATETNYESHLTLQVANMFELLQR